MRGIPFFILVSTYLIFNRWYHQKINPNFPYFFKERLASGAYPIYASSTSNRIIRILKIVALHGPDYIVNVSAKD